MAHEPRLTEELRCLLWTRRVAALGSLCADGTPLVSMVPYAIEPGTARLIIHVSRLARHSRNLQASPSVSLLVMRPEVEGEPVHALPRVSLEGHCEILLRASADWELCRASYLERFAQAEPMTEFADFMFVAIRLTGARLVAGFAAARNVDAVELASALRAAPLARQAPGKPD